MKMNLYLICSPSYDPYFNLALEEYLLSLAEPNKIFLYLWQNDHTVVIGRNQNPWVECRTELLQSEGGKLARRQSGGGAVYHDLGNLNFTFLCPEKEYDLHKNLSVIDHACRYAGLSPAFSGRNDLLVDGKKFSGNAFFHTKGYVYHHGTLLIRSDIERLERYLSPPKAKLESKGISSVRSRVINLSQLTPELNCNTMKSNMIQAFATVFGRLPIQLYLTEEEITTVELLSQKYSDHDWLFGKPFPFTCSIDGRLPLGTIQLQLQVQNGIIVDLQVYTDAIDHQIPYRIRQALCGCQFQLDAITQACRELDFCDDLCALIQQQVL